MKTLTTIFASLFIASAACAGEQHGGQHGKPGSDDRKITQATNVTQSARSESSAQARASAKSRAKANSEATGGNGTGGNATGGAGGSGGLAFNGGQTQIFSPVLGLGGGLSGATTIKNVAEPPAPSMPAVTPCTTGWSSGISWSGFSIGGGGYYKDLLCQWERMHAVAVASNDEQGAKNIRQGMLLITCEDTPPERRKYFKPCDALPRQPDPESTNSPFSSAG